VNILYLAPLGDDSSLNGGYSFVAKSFDSVFKKLKDKDIIKNYTCISLNNAKDKIAVQEKYDIGIILTHPNSFQDQSLKWNIENLRKRCNKFYLHVFWESSELPSHWDWMFTSDLFTGFISSSDFVSLLIKHKIAKFQSQQSVHKVYPFINDIDNKIDIDIKQKEDKFTVLYMGQYTKRKGFEDSLVSFIHALGDKEDAQLYMKHHRLSPFEADEQDFIKRTLKMNCKNFKADIFTITENLSREQIYNLYQNSSVLLFLSRGEGLGLPLVEAGMIGLPIIYANNSSCSEFAIGRNVHIVPCIYDLAVNMTHYSYEGDYGIPLLKDAVDKLKLCYDKWKTDKKEYYKIDSRQLLKKMFSEENVTKQIQQLL
jgi:glycosyltransferase involved in cell wall biosynthesis